MPYKTIPHIKREDITVIDNITGLFKINNCGIVCRLGNFFTPSFNPTKFFGDAYINVEDYIGIARRLAKDESIPLQVGETFTADSPQWIQIEGDYNGWYLHCAEKCMIGEDGVYKLKPFSDLIDIFKQGGVIEGVNWFDYYYGPVDEPFGGTLTAFARIELNDVLTEDDWDISPAPTEGGWIRDLVRGEHTVAELIANLEGTPYATRTNLKFGMAPVEGGVFEGNNIQVQVEWNSKGWSAIFVSDNQTWEEFDDVPDDWYPDTIAYTDYSSYPYQVVSSAWDDVNGTLKVNNSYMGKIYREEIPVSNLMETLGLTDVSELEGFAWTVDGELVDVGGYWDIPYPNMMAWTDDDGLHWDYVDANGDLVSYPPDGEMRYIWSAESGEIKALPWDDELGQPIVGGTV